MNPNPDEKEYPFDIYKMKKASIILRALNHKLRQLIIRVIYQNKEITVTDLYIKLRIEQSVASQHLALLRKADIVSAKRVGKFIYYSINFFKIESIEMFVEKLLQ